MKTYGQFCPVAQALEVLAERWTLLIVRELLMGSTRFSEIQRGVPRMSRTLLSQRLTTLQDYGIITRRDSVTGPEYELTESGHQLQPIVERIGIWGKQHAARAIGDDELDPKLLMWDLQRRLHVDRLPAQRTVVLFRFSDARAGEARYWLHLLRPDVDLCLANPGFPVDLIVESDVRTLTEVWMGKRALVQAIRERRLQLEGNTRLKRAFPGWLKLSTFAQA